MAINAPLSVGMQLFVYRAQSGAGGVADTFA
jgi:hypothetical protein